MMWGRKPKVEEYKIDFDCEAILNKKKKGKDKYLVASIQEREIVKLDLYEKFKDGRVQRKMKKEKGIPYKTKLPIQDFEWLRQEYINIRFSLKLESLLKSKK